MRVLEFGDNKAAGYCGRLFQLFGAEVVRIDLPVRPTPNDAEIAQDIYLHTGKKRCAIDYLRESGETLLARLAAEVDIVITDLSPIGLDRLGWGSFPGKLRVSISPFGLTGPYRDWQGAGPILLAMGGYTYLMGDPDKAPLTLQADYVEYQAGQFAYTAALANHTFGGGARDIEVSMFETVMSLSQFTTVMWTCQRLIRSRHGNRFENVYPVSLYSCKDGFVYINIVPGFWRALVALLGREDLLTDERFRSNTGRQQNQAALDEIINEVFAPYTMAELLELGQREHRFPIGSAMTLEQVLADEHLQSRHYWRSVAVPGRGTVKAPGSAFRKLPLRSQPMQTWEGEATTDG